MGLMVRKSGMGVERFPMGKTIKIDYRGGGERGQTAPDT
jgi:hypothetical protein